MSSYNYQSICPDEASAKKREKTFTVTFTRGSKNYVLNYNKITTRELLEKLKEAFDLPSWVDDDEIILFHIPNDIKKYEPFKEEWLVLKIFPQLIEPEGLKFEVIIQKSIISDLLRRRVSPSKKSDANEIEEFRANLLLARRLTRSSLA